MTERQKWLIVIILFAIIFFISPFGQAAIFNYANTFTIIVEVESSYKADTYWYGEHYDRSFTLDQPVMKCKIVNINRNFYQRNNIVDYEHNIGDIIYIEELHGDVYQVGTQITFKIRRNQVLSNQYKNIGECNDYIVNALNSNNIVKGKQPNDLNDLTTKVNTPNTTISNEEIESYIHDYKNVVPDDQEEQIQLLLEEKYKETHLKVYIIFFDTNDDTYIKKYASDLIDYRDEAVCYCRNKNDNNWYVRWNISDSKSDYFKNNYTRIGDAYLIRGNYVDRAENIANIAYEVYQESDNKGE